MLDRNETKKSYHQPNIYCLGNVKNLTKGCGSKSKSDTMAPVGDNKCRPSSLGDPLDSLGNFGDPLE